MGLKIVFVAAGGMFATIFAGEIEGQIAPVVSEAVIERTEPTKNGYTRIWGSFFIDRPSCSFAGLKWRLSGAVRDVTANVIFEEGTKERPGGYTAFGPWLVQLTEDQINNASVSSSFHNCPWRWWETETQFFPQK